jgi:hypothetical protein
LAAADFEVLMLSNLLASEGARMEPRNKQGREIWFDRWLWSYMPCHWKGWVLLLGSVIIVNASVWLLMWLTNADADDPRPFLALPVGIIALLIVVERHSPSRME